MGDAADWNRLSDDEVVGRFSGTRKWARGDERAPHKPLLLLYALAALQRGEDRLIPFATIEEKLGNLLREFGPPRTTRPEYPFWHLQSDGLWTIPQREILQADIDDASHRHNPRLSVIRKSGAEGGLPPELFELLRSRPNLVNRIAHQVLEDQWEPSYHQEILDAVGMPWVQVGARRKRDPGFRETILRIYEHRCAICGWDGQLGNTYLALEAAHVRWHTVGGPDSADNGICLCTFHHKVFDRGAIALTDDCCVLVSQHVRGSHGLEEWLLRFAGTPISSPLVGEPAPSAQNLGWHRQEVFRAPERLRHGSNGQ